MDSRFISSVFFLALSFTSVTHAEDICEPDSFTKQQCTFNTEALLHNQKTVVSSVGNSDFMGSASASCRFGTVVFDDVSCLPKDPDTCSITDMIWANSNSQCSHEKVDSVLGNGESKTISSITSPGSISYQCSNGTLSITDKECGVVDSPVGNNGFSQTVTAQNLTQETAAISFKMNKSKTATDSAFLASADRQCARVLDGYLIGQNNVAVTPDGTSSENYTIYDVTCSMEIDELRCDEGAVNDLHVGGRYNDRNGEFTLTPGYTEAVDMCKRRGYSGLVEFLGVTRSYPNVVDDFSLLAICSGKTSQCEVDNTPLGSPIIQSAVNCQKANVRSGLLKVSYGQIPNSSQIQSEACSPLGFTSLETFSTPRIEDETGAFQYYTTTAVCSGYEGSEPLLESCIDDGTGNESKGSVTRISCNVGEVDAVMQGSYDPATGEYSLQPSDADIKLELCESNDYAKLDSVLGSTRIGTKGYFSVQAQCSEYFGSDSQSCADESPCYGDIIDSSSQKPKFCLGNGTCYENLCANDPIDVEECLECSGSFTFTDSNTGSSCGLFIDSIASALSEDVVFENELVNGNANVFCNDGVMSVGGPSECYKSCQSGVVVGWKDKNNSTSCGQVIPSNSKGYYTQGAVVNLSSSLEHTGSATATCDNGNWVVSGSSCKLDCLDNVSWGSGTDALGRNKYNLCTASPSRTTHGGSITAKNTTSGASGEQALTCNDGSWSKGSSSTCYSDCSSGTVTWGGVCKATVSNTDHAGSVSISHQGNSSYAYDWSVQGSGTASCSDGKWTTSGTCNYVVQIVYGSWTSWKMDRESCSSTPLASTVNLGTRFTQTKTCYQDWSRYRTVKWRYNTGTLVNKPNENQTDDRVAVTTSTQTGTKDYIVNSNATTSYSTYGSWSCGSYGPSTSTVDAGTSFRQTRSCSRTVYNRVTVEKVYASGKRVEVDDYLASTSTENKTDSRNAVGTNPVDNCRYDSNNYIVEDESESSDYGQEDTEEKRYYEEWFWNGQSVYYKIQESGRSGNRNESSGSKSGYSYGDVKKQESGGGVSNEYFYAEWMICKDSDTTTPPPVTTGTWSSPAKQRSVTRNSGAPGSCFQETDRIGYPETGSQKSGSCSTVGETFEYTSLVGYRGSYCEVAHLKQTCQ
jgi:hypothetical protein